MKGWHPRRGRFFLCTLGTRNQPPSRVSKLILYTRFGRSEWLRASCQSAFRTVSSLDSCSVSWEHGGGLAHPTWCVPWN